MGRFGEWEDYEYTRPLPAQGGIAARSQRGAIGETWWSQRFIGLLESFGVGSRLTRGRSYARRGQVVELDVEPGVVLAKVQGSRYSPYKVRIRVEVLSDAQWRRAEKAMAAQALPLATLLAGEMPRDIEDVLAAAKIALFPRSSADLKATCTCPDWENPCKHVAAVYYILAEQFDADPFLIFAWRGRLREELLVGLRTRRAAGSGHPASPARRSCPRSGPDGPVSDADQSADAGAAAANPAGDGRLPLVPLTAQLDRFWVSGPGLAQLVVNPLTDDTPDLLPRELGPAPDHCGGANLTEQLTSAYATLADAAQRRAMR